MKPTTPLNRIRTAATPLLIALGITSLLILLFGHNPLVVFGTLISGGIGTKVKIADSLVVWISLAIVSAGLLITYRAGQWNIGIEGQIGVGAIFAFGAGRMLWESNGWVAIPLMLLSGMLGGVIWGILVAILKIYGGVNEIFGGLGLNFMATSLTIYLISGPWKPIGESSVSTTPLLPRPLWLTTLPGLRLTPVALIAAIATVTMVYYALRGTVWGLQLKAVGRNIKGAYLLGVPTRRILFSAYISCGAAAGLAGAFLVTAVRHQLLTNISAGYGFLSILVVLLTGFRASLIAPIALFFATLGIGGSALPIRLHLDSSLGGVLLGLIVLSYELMQGWRERQATLKKAQA